MIQKWKQMSSKRQRSIVLGGLGAIILLMAIGYAAFSTQLQINGTSNISSNWDIRITNITSSLHGGATNAIEPTYDNQNGLTASFSTNLVSPGDYAEYTIEVSNLGDIDAALTDINISDSGNPAIVFETSGLSEGDNLLKDSKDELIVKVSYSDSVTSQPANTTSNITVTLTYEQASGGTPPSGGNQTIGGQDVEIVTTGDGLYEDSYESGRLIYRGQNPNNYIMFNDELWRIIAKETDGTYKIIRNEVSLQEMAFDEANHRSVENNTYCNIQQYGCGFFAGIEGTFEGINSSGTITEDSSIAVYLNGTYYTDSINENSKTHMIRHSFNIGPIQSVTANEVENDSIDKNLSGEKMYVWYGNVGLANVTDILKASMSVSCTSANSTNAGGGTCPSYLTYYDGIIKYWLINADSTMSMFVWSATAGNAFGVGVSSSYADDSYISMMNSYPNARPVVFLKSDITLSGTGTSVDPFVITN